MKNKIIVVASGGFDPVHSGHIEMFKNAKKLGDKLIVIINDDNFLLRKKGFLFMPLKERIKVIKSIKYVDRVVKSIDKDMSVNKTLEKLKPNFFVNGGDRTIDNTEEIDICKKNNIKMIFGIAPQLCSSTKLFKNANKIYKKNNIQ